MGYEHKCLCGANNFKLFYDVYCKERIFEPHLEVVCQECNRGFVIRLSEKKEDKLRD